MRKSLSSLFSAMGDIVAAGVVIQGSVLIAVMTYYYALYGIPPGEYPVNWQRLFLFFDTSIFNAALLGTWTLALFEGRFSLPLLLGASLVYGALLQLLTGSPLLMCPACDPAQLPVLALFTYASILLGGEFFSHPEEDGRFRV